MKAEDIRYQHDLERYKKLLGNPDVNGLTG